ncbi:MAG: flagellar biosynthetic protein FliR [Sphingobium sp.]|jgi:flagellar biosynthetic protein FliR|nr:flagellar biosynthetic protein FliR [Sphingobium sp.]MCP5399394.1 flagellar biosynthetic protein FliR [Sphingomonas sp.]
MLYALVFARMGAMLMLLPGFSDDAVPGRLRLLIALAVAAGLQGMVGAHTGAALDTVMSDDAGFAHMLLVELLTGLLLGGVVRLMFLAITIAGAIISLNVGLTSALVNDPSAGGQVPILARFISVSALLVCMGMGVHHLWLGALVDSYIVFPVGRMPPSADFAQLALNATTGAMALGLSLAAPIVIYGIIFNTALGLAARLAPQLQIFFIGQPLNILLGIALTTAALAASLTGFAGRMAEWAQALSG